MTAHRLLVLMSGLMIVVTSSVLAVTPPGNPMHGQKLYKQHCLRCHGAKLDGNGPDADSLRVRPTNFHTYLTLARGTRELEEALRQGRNFTPMHAWDPVLTDQEVYDLVAYIRSEVPPLEVKP
ncbi:MAG TPA: cytochrome c [Nitrospira sp.]